MPKPDENAERFAGRQDRSIPDQERPEARQGQGQGRGGAPQNEQAAAAHAARDERQQSKVYTFAGDDEGHAAGEVNKLGKAGPGMSRVRPVGGGDEFVVRNDLLQGPDDGDEAEGEGEAPVQG